MSRLTINSIPSTSKPIVAPIDQWLTSLTWENGPQPLVAASSKNDVECFVTEFRKNLASRLPQKKIAPRKRSLSFPQFEHPALEVFEAVKRGDPLSLEEQGGDVEIHLTQVVALLDALSCKSKGCGSHQYLQYLQLAWNETRIIADFDIQADSPLARMFAAEALLLSGAFFNGVVGMKHRRKQARSRIAATLDEWTDTDGTPHASLLPVLPAWLASIVRTTDWAQRSGFRLWTRSDLERIEGLLKATALLTSPDGTVALSDQTVERAILKEAAGTFNLKPDSLVHKLILELTKNKPSTRKLTWNGVANLRKSDKASPPVVQSDWAKIAVLRERWQVASDRVALTHQQALPQIDFRAHGQAVFTGDWQLSIEIDEQPVELSPDWDAVSWYSDRDVDYIELQWITDLDLIVCRQVALVRGAHQLLFAESVSTPNRSRAKIRVESSLPLASSACAHVESVSKECRVRAGDVMLRCLPFAIPMDRFEHSTNSFKVNDERITIRREGQGGIYSPLLVDWHPERYKAPADWRALTVTEDRRRLDTSEVSAHRVRMGNDQLLIYRNLSGSKSMRAVLGYHHNHETAIGRFTSDGDFEPLVLVE